MSRTHFATRGRRRGTTIRFRLARPARVELVVIGPNCQVVMRKHVHGKAGQNRVRFAGRVHGHPLAPGRYAIEIVTVRGATRKQIGRIAVEVVRPGRRLSRREQSAPVAAPCGGSASSAAGPALPAATIDASRPPPAAFGVAGATAQRVQPTKTSGPGILRPPHFLPSEGGFNLSWALLGLAGALALAIAVYVVRFMRNPGEPTG